MLESDTERVLRAICKCPSEKRLRQCSQKPLSQLMDTLKATREAVDVCESNRNNPRVMVYMYEISNAVVNLTCMKVDLLYSIA